MLQFCIFKVFLRKIWDSFIITEIQSFRIFSQEVGSSSGSNRRKPIFQLRIFTKIGNVFWSKSCNGKNEKIYNRTEQKVIVEVKTKWSWVNLRTLNKNIYWNQNECVWRCEIVKIYGANFLFRARARSAPDDIRQCLLYQRFSVSVLHRPTMEINSFNDRLWRAWNLNDLRKSCLESMKAMVVARCSMLFLLMLKYNFFRRHEVSRHCRTH